MMIYKPKGVRLMLLPSRREINTYRRIANLVSAFLLLLTLPAMGLGQPQGIGESHNIEIASDEELDVLRGGFVLPNGMTVNISINQDVFRNGIRTHTSYFELPETFLSIRPSQSASANPVSGDAIGSITQNALNNQLIEIMRIVDIELLNVTNSGLDISGQRLFTQFIEGNL